MQQIITKASDHVNSPRNLHFSSFFLYCKYSLHIFFPCHTLVFGLSRTVLQADKIRRQLPCLHFDQHCISSVPTRGNRYNYIMDLYFPTSFSTYVITLLCNNVGQFAAQDLSLAALPLTYFVAV